MGNATTLGRVDFVMVQHLQHAWDRACRDGADPHLAVMREERFFDLVCGMDPTPSRRYVMWLSRWRRRQWDEMGLSGVPGASALARLAEGLANFDEIRRYLPSDRRDINRYLTADELLDACSSIPAAGTRELRRQRRRQAIADSDILFEQTGWKLVRLRSREAACWWGMGTRWCTAARSDNRFEMYALRGDLLVLCTPAGRFQLSRQTGEFRDAADAPASLTEALADSPEQLRDLLLIDREYRNDPRGA
jgi:hypothetical protein